MRKLGSVIVLLLAVPCLGGRKPKEKNLLPPIASHNLAIAGYGCDKQEVTDMTASTSKNTSVWTLVVWAQYGDKHGRYWQKTYGTYQIAIKESMGSNGESARTGGSVGLYENPNYDFSSMDKACKDWMLQVRSALKVEPNGAETKQ